MPRKDKSKRGLYQRVTFPEHTVCYAAIYQFKKPSDEITPCYGAPMRSLHESVECQICPRL